MHHSQSQHRNQSKIATPRTSAAQGPFSARNMPRSGLQCCILGVVGILADSMRENCIVQPYTPCDHSLRLPWGSIQCLFTLHYESVLLQVQDWNPHKRRACAMCLSTLMGLMLLYEDSLL